MEESTSQAAWAGLGIVMILFIIALSLAFYVFLSYCYKRICEKTGKQPGAVIWIPIVRYIPLLQVAKMPEWLVILLLIPFVNFVVAVIMWANVCTARGKSPWLVILFFVPIPVILFVCYLAFSE